MTGKFTNILIENEILQERNSLSNEKILKLKENLSEHLGQIKIRKNYCCFCAGSLARGDCGSESDLDIFMMSNSKKPITTLEKYQIFGKIISANNFMKFPDLSNDGQYLQLHSYKEMENTLGHPKDDYINLFTTRMLLILESRPVFNEKIYDEVLNSVIDLYFRDKNGSGDSFVPIFILNDILRYWRTMCLNYETIRTDKHRPWRKKNINLKFSRMLSVYSAVIPAILGHAKNQNEWISMCKKSPLLRIATALDRLDDNYLVDSYRVFLESYCSFLSWKDLGKDDIEIFLTNGNNKKEIKEKSEIFSDFIFSILSHKAVDIKMKKFLAI